MPHIIVEYSANIREELKPETFLRKIHQVAIDTGAFPPGSLRTRASERTSYLVTDGHPSNAFVHITMRLRPRSAELKREIGEKVFAFTSDYLKPIFESRPLGLTFEIQEIDTDSRFLKSTLRDYENGRRLETPLAAGAPSAGDKK